MISRLLHRSQKEASMLLLHTPTGLEVVAWVEKQCTIELVAPSNCHRPSRIAEILNDIDLTASMVQQPQNTFLLLVQNHYENTYGLNILD
mmetsp:Transcript_17619/g.43353  ORF Transcript_17619/g.43353 Transcript_17619/m.43353 type:complete len:90 (-) Transcript_17619:1944-2213(-)